MRDTQVLAEELGELDVRDLAAAIVVRLRVRVGVGVGVGVGIRVGVRVRARVGVTCDRSSSCRRD